MIVDRPTLLYRFTARLLLSTGIVIERKVWAKDFINAGWLIRNWPGAFRIGGTFSIMQISHNEDDRLATFYDPA